MTLALKYRPKRFDDVVGQPLVVDVLKNVMKEGMKYRAFIFAGMFGSGKTSAARIFGKAINCANPDNFEPCLQCETCLGTESGSNTGHYIELDGASHGSIESIRRIQEVMQYRPMAAKFTVVVIDEAHQLSTAAWNSCLKLIEEPPDHAVFLFVTTEHDRIPETIRSRCLDIKFGRMSSPEIISRLMKICTNENISVEPGCLELIVDHTQGVMRDSITVLEQFSIMGSSNITRENINKYIDLAYAISVEELVGGLMSRDFKKVCGMVVSVIDTNGDVVVMARKIVSFLRGYWMHKNGVKPAGFYGSTEAFDTINLDIKTCLTWQEHMIAFLSKVGHDRGLTNSLFLNTLGKMML